MNEQTFGKDCKYFVRNESLNNWFNSFGEWIRLCWNLHLRFDRNGNEIESRSEGSVDFFSPRIRKLTRQRLTFNQIQLHSWVPRHLVLKETPVSIRTIIDIIGLLEYVSVISKRIRYYYINVIVTSRIINFLIRRKKRLSGEGREIQNSLIYGVVLEPLRIGNNSQKIH